jgi:hypothetical protein
MGLYWISFLHCRKPTTIYKGLHFRRIGNIYHGADDAVTKGASVLDTARILLRAFVYSLCQLDSKS